MSPPTLKHSAGPEAARGIEVRAPVPAEHQPILGPNALAFVAKLERVFESRRRELLEARLVRQREIDGGRFPEFLPATVEVRESEWEVATIPDDLRDRRVEITGPVDRKMIINALNSGANVFMADFEDSNSPTWTNNVAGQANLYDAVRRSITYESPEGKRYELGSDPATLLVRPRGWHLVENHVTVGGVPVSGALFDFGLFFYHNAAELLKRGTGPYFYLPKLESHIEARLWNDVFNFAQDELGIARGSIRATVLIETIHAAFEMDEILWELRDHSAGLNCGRWDYIFSFIKTFRTRPDYTLPDRAQVTMDRHFLQSYVDLLIKTCHRRGIHAMGGMAAQIPIKNDPAANEAAVEKVRLDKLREVKAGHDGTWVAHPGLIAIARTVFDAEMAAANQISRGPQDVGVRAQDLLTVPDGTITEGGLRTNIDVGIQYLEAWLGGNGCVPIYNLMEDAATAEISRSQVWQWLAHGATLDDGRTVTRSLVEEIMASELAKLRERLGTSRFDGGQFGLASQLFTDMMTGDHFEPFMTTAAYNHLD